MHVCRQCNSSCHEDIKMSLAVWCSYECVYTHGGAVSTSTLTERQRRRKVAWHPAYKAAPMRAMI